MNVVTFLYITTFALNMASAQPPSIHYSLSMSKPSTHLLEVEIKYDGIPGGEEALDVLLPVWRPGRYLVLDFASGVQEFSASDAKGNPLRWHKAEKSMWRVEARGSASVTVRYKIFANEFNQRTRGLNDQHAFVDGAAVFMYVEKFRHLPLTVTIHPYKEWHVTTGLEGSGNMFAAPNYDYLVDCPIEIGKQKDFTFEVDGVPHVLTIFGEGNWNADTLIRDLSKIVKIEKEFWGGFPYKRYVFLLHCTPSSGGGTEHINSTIMGSRPFIFKNPDSYRGFLGLVSHEYFHTWNVKQLRPKGIHPYDYMKENYSRELWIAEGTTSYYDDLLLMRAGFKTAEKYLEGIAVAVQGDQQRPGNTVQPLAEASFDAWVKYWRGTEQSFNSESDYYGKGANVSLVLDLEIRQRTVNKHSLDDVLRAMYKRFPLSGPGYTLEDFKSVAEEFVGGSLQQFFDRYVQGVQSLPWEESLLCAGLQLLPKDSTVRAWIGLSTSDIGEKTRITRVTAGSPAYIAGLDIGDEVLALDGIRARTSDFNDRIGEMKPGDNLTITVFRNDQLRDFKVTLATAVIPTYKIAKIAHPSDVQRQIYQSWLQSPWDTSEGAKTSH
ncbi:MAG: M61 family metallopeptidase [Ignavibacteria bacterium]|nr:M61 family metallopeptidase [Ignavibacteria bacterium]MBI3765368.1 M61 family metallopeptidase [Ignavibacteriales bacterium]